MDARHTVDVTRDISTIPRIERRVEWRAKAPSHPLHLGLAAGWVGLLYMIGLFTVSSADAADAAPLGLFDTVAAGMLLITIVGIFGVISLALQNSKATAPASIIAGLSIVTIGATCGFVGHPVSAWGGGAAFAGVLVAASVAIMSRGEKVEA